MKRYFLKGLETVFGDEYKRGFLFAVSIIFLMVSGLTVFFGLLIGVLVLFSEGGGVVLSAPFLVAGLVAIPVFITTLGFMEDKFN